MNSPNGAQMVVFKCTQILSLQRMTKYLTKSLWSPCYKVSNREIKELHGPLALEKLNKCVEKKNVDYDTKRNSTFLKETQEI